MTWRLDKDKAGSGALGDIGAHIVDLAQHITGEHIVTVNGLLETFVRERPLPLQGIKILDLTRVLAGPLSAQMLGDLGAEVIKIERPGGGDDARAFGPPYLKDPEGKANNNNSFYLCANRNKKSVTVNIASPEGQDIIRELAKSCDVMMENYKVGDLKRYRLDYESIKAINPGIIYCSVTGFGQTGPYAPRAGYDAILQAMGGLMSVTGHIDGEPGEGPMKVGPSIVDYMTGMNTSIGILSALFHRKANGGEGQHVDVCLFDTVIASLSHWLQIYLVNGQTPPRRGTWGNGGMPAGVFRCTDGELMLVVGNDGQFARTCAVLGAPELATDQDSSRTTTASCTARRSWRSSPGCS